jgi:hypothetical protein
VPPMTASAPSAAATTTPNPAHRRRRNPAHDQLQ